LVGCGVTGIQARLQFCTYGKYPAGSVQ
jgi:hypothetical protein